MITSNEKNASVYVKGELLGQIENRIFTANLSLGNQEIELRKAGFKSEIVTREITLENNRIEINLEAALPIPVTITTEPEGATVYIDNVLFGKTPKSSFFSAGTYPIRIEKESYGSINEQITVYEPEIKK
jgi:hypothetical protein